MKPSRFSASTAIRLLLLLLLVVPSSAFSAPRDKEPPKPELVLREGARLEVTSPAGGIAIVAGGGLARRYEWKGCALEANMHARRVRWLGSLGMYDPAGRTGNPDFLKYPSCNGISRTVVEEGQMHFPDIDAAEEWIRHRPQGHWTTVWTNNGLVVSWITSPSYSDAIPVGNLSADLKLVCINGERPTKLAGATDQAIRPIHKNGPAQAIHNYVKVGNDVIAETQRTLTEEWKKTNAYRDRINRR